MAITATATPDTAADAMAHALHPAAIGVLHAFSYAFMQRALAEVALMGVVCGLLGVLVVLRGLTYSGESLSHALVPGAAVAVVAGLPVLAGALVGGVAAALAIAVLLRRPEVGEDTAVSVVVTGIFALGVVLLATRGTPRDLDSILFGSVLSVDRADLWLGLGAALAIAAIVAALGRRLVLVAFDRQFAGAIGMSAGLLDAVLLVALAGALTVALRGVGTLLVLALLVAPAAAARALVRRVWAMLLLAPALAVASGVAGLELSYLAGWAAGPAICLVALGVFAAGLALGTARGRLARRTAAGRAATPLSHAP